MARKKKVDQVILAAGDEIIDENTNVEEHTVDGEQPTEGGEEETTVNSELEDFVTRGYVLPGYIPVAGEWYPPIEEVRPRVYHKYAHEDIYQTLYPDLINNEEEPADGGEGGEDEPVVDPDNGGETPVVDDPTEPTDGGETETTNPDNGEEGGEG